MKKQYCIAKYVMAESVAEAINKSRSIPITEVYIHSSWLEKNKDNNMFEPRNTKMGFREKHENSQ